MAQCGTSYISISKSLDSKCMISNRGLHPGGRSTPEEVAPMSRARLITAAAFAGNLGWGAILPYQYAYVVNARHWGSTTGVLTGTLFCLGAVLTAPFAGRLADRYSAARLAVGFELLAAVAAVAMG